MINFATLKGLTIPEGVVTQIADASGRVLWKLEASKPVILEVEKITSDTYAGETTYTGEQFILLDIYPEKSNSTVNVTYGGFTKTLIFSGTNAKQVFFGTFNGVADEVETPDSGMLTIEGGCSGFACGAYKTKNKGEDVYYNCITGIVEWGGVTKIPDYCLYNCGNIELSELPSGITNIGAYAFNACTNLRLTELPSGITNIGAYAFNDCPHVTPSTLPIGLTSIGNRTFHRGYTGYYAWKDKYDRITIHKNITSIGVNAFTCRDRETENSEYACGYYCNVREIYMESTVPPTLSASAFSGYLAPGGTSSSPDTDTTIYVPAGCGEAYRTTEEWTYYADMIVEVS